MKAGDILDAPCLFCGYNGSGYFQAGTHGQSCPFRDIGGDEERLAFLETTGRLLTRRAMASELAALRACVRAGDRYIAAMHEIGNGDDAEAAFAGDYAEKADYYSARAKVTLP